MATTITKKRVNFTIDISLLNELNQLVAEGERSEFINSALEEKLTDYGRRKAAVMMEAAKKKLKLKVSTDQILKEIRYGRL